jgi:hypothetical protein
VQGILMKIVRKIFPIGHFVISLLFIGCALALIGFAGFQLWQGIQPIRPVALPQRLNAVLESIALLTVAVAALELGQTIIEEEVQREAQMSAPTRVRRFLSRFMIVLVVALAIEALVAVFEFSHEHPAHLPYAAPGLAAPPTPRGLGAVYLVEPECGAVGARSHGTSQAGRCKSRVN